MTNFQSKILRPENSKKLFDAITYERLGIAKELLESGYNPNALDEFGQNPLFRIVYNKTDTQIDFLQLFISFGANVNFQKPDGSTPIFFATGSALKFLLENGAKVTIRNNHGSTPLHGVSQVEDAELLIAMGLDINEKDYSLSTLLHGSVYGSNSLVKFCVEHGADVNAKDINGRTPLMCLALTEYVTEKNEQLDILTKAQYFIEAGADINMADNDGKTAPDHANSVNNNKFAEWLKTLNAK